MAANKIIRLGPVALTNVLTTNIWNFNVTSLAGPVGFTLTQPVVIIRFIRIVNRTGSAAWFSFWLGATGANLAGTEVIGQGFSVPGNFAYQTSDALRMDATDFLVGGASVNSALTLEASAEIGFA